MWFLKCWQNHNHHHVNMPDRNITEKFCFDELAVKQSFYHLDSNNLRSSRIIYNMIRHIYPLKYYMNVLTFSVKFSITLFCLYISVDMLYIILYHR